MTAISPVQFLINAIPITETADITINGYQLIVTKFTDLQQLNDGVINSFECVDGTSTLFIRPLSTLGKYTNVYRSFNLNIL